MNKDPGTVMRESVIGSLITWLILAGICFGLLPFVLRVVPFKSLEVWVVPSVIGGIVGSIMTGIASSGVASAKNTLSSNQQKIKRGPAGIIGTIGILLVLFPLFLSGWTFYKVVSTTDWQNLFKDRPVLDQLIK